MATVEERLAHIEKFLNDRAGFEPIPDPRYVQVVLDEAVERGGTYLKPYTYEDITPGGLVLGDRVSAPVGRWGNRKEATVVGVDTVPPRGYDIKPVHQRLD